MRILWVKAGGLVPPDVGGRIRSYNILRQLAKRHAVTFFGFHPADRGDAHAQLEGLFEKVVCVPLRMSSAGTLGDYAGFAANLFSRMPYSVAKYCRPEVARALRQLAATSEFDLAVCDFLLPAAILPWEMRCPKVIFTHNVEALIWKRRCEVSRNPLWKLVSWREYRAMDAFERRYLRQADHVLAVSEADCAYFRRFLPAEGLSIIPTGVDVEYFRPANGSERPDSLVFTGAMDWHPNEDGILFFVAEILPRIRRVIPGVSLTIVGRDPSPRLRALDQERSAIRVTGRVDDIRRYVADGAVYIVPLRVGSGTRLKVFEAMAMGKAVVSTPVGAEGLPVQHGQDLLLAESPGDFADRVIELLRNPAERLRLGNNARALVESRYGWSAVADCFEAALARVTSPFPVDPAPAGAQRNGKCPGEAVPS